MYGHAREGIGDGLVTKVRDTQWAGKRPARNREAAPVAADGDRAKRQNHLLDEGLKETFPASDPVSIVRVE